MHKTVFHFDFNITPDDFNFNYQESLTKKLDSNLKDFDQNILNEIVLWKVNRYAEFDPNLISLINSIESFDPNLISLINSIESKAVEIDIDKTKLILIELLKTNGVQLAMASTILRYKNPRIYQIIDQRVFRIIYENQELKLNTYSSEKNLNYQIDLYLQYLADLKKVCLDLDIPFDKSDRILFMADRRINKMHKLNNY